jgi:hypothetical protein
MPMWGPGKEYLTRDGSRARVYATDGGEAWPIHGAIMENGEWRSEVWDLSGRESPDGKPSCFDLMPPKPPVVVSDAVLIAYDRAVGHDNGIAAAIAQYLSEQAE